MGVWVGVGGWGAGVFGWAWVGGVQVVLVGGRLMITFVYSATDWVQRGARYRGGGDVKKKNAREARSVTLSDTSPALG